MKHLMKILILCPFIGVHHSISRRLRASGIALLFPASSIEALKMVKLHGTSLDLAIIHREGFSEDLAKDSEEGIELVHEIKSDPAQADLPMIITSSRWGDPEFAEHQQGPDGANAYLHWPFSDVQMVQVIEEMFGSPIRFASGSETQPSITTPSASQGPDRTATAGVTATASKAGGETASAAPAPSRTVPLPPLPDSSSGTLDPPTVVIDDVDALIAASAGAKPPPPVPSGQSAGRNPPTSLPPPAPAMATSEGTQRSGSLVPPPVPRPESPSSVIEKASNILGQFGTALVDGGSGRSPAGPPPDPIEFEPPMLDGSMGAGMILRPPVASEPEVLDLSNLDQMEPHERLILDNAVMPEASPGTQTIDVGFEGAPSGTAGQGDGGIEISAPAPEASAAFELPVMGDVSADVERIEVVGGEASQAPEGAGDGASISLAGPSLEVPPFAAATGADSEQGEGPEVGFGADEVLELPESAGLPEPMMAAEPQVESETEGGPGPDSGQSPPDSEELPDPPSGSAEPPDDGDLPYEMPYLFGAPGRQGNVSDPNLFFSEPVGDAVVPGGAAHSPDIETLKKYLLLREQDVAVLSNQLKAARDQASAMEKLVKEERARNLEVTHALGEQQRRLDEADKEKGLTLSALQAELDELRFQNKAKTDRARLMETQVREAAEEIERLKERVRSDIRKIRVRERELENRLEITKKDSEALLTAREQKIIELKRKVDLLEFNMDLLQDQYTREKENSALLRERLAKAAQVVRVAEGLLESQGRTRDAAGESPDTDTGKDKDGSGRQEAS